MRKRLYCVDGLDGRYFSSREAALRALAERFTILGKERERWYSGLQRIAAGLYSPVPTLKKLPARVSLVDRMPPVYNQASRGTCAANAATALMEYYLGKPQRLSVQYLYERVKREELETYRVAAAEVEAGRMPSDVDLAAGVRNVLGERSMTVQDIVSEFRHARVEQDGGSNAKWIFRVLEKYGICSYDLWPYAREQLEELNEVNEFVERPVPPGADADAKRRRLNDEVYIFPSPNNVEEIKGYLAGSNRHRPMPVFIGAAVFDNVPLDGGVVRLPKVRTVEVKAVDCEVERLNLAEGECRDVSADPSTAQAVGSVSVLDQRYAGGHAMLLVGYEDDDALPGGGAFIVRNSWGEDWGEDGYARMPYAYVELFVSSAATILVPAEETAAQGFAAAADAAADEWAPYARRAPCDMKNRKGLRAINKGDRILMNDDEGVADVDTPENRVVFKRNGFRWRAAAPAEPAADPAARAAAGASAPGTACRFFTQLEMALKTLAAFPYLGGLRKPGLFGRDVKVESCAACADLSSPLGEAMKLYSVHGGKTTFRIAAVYLGAGADPAVCAEKARQLLLDYNRAQRFSPVDCSITVVGSDGPIGAAVPPLLSDDEVRLVAEAYTAETGWRMHVPEKPGDPNWCRWAAALAPNTAEQTQRAVLAAWEAIDAGGQFHVTAEKLAEKTGLPPDVVRLVVDEKIPSLRRRGDKIVKA